jgi:single-strand DNA-binding protein
LTKDIELKQAGGFSVTEFTVAWSEKYKETETKCFARCKAWRNTAEFLNKYFKKGQELVVEGKLVTESWEKDGQTQSRTIVSVEKAHFCGTKSSNSNGQSLPSPEEDPDGFKNIPDGIEEELPFV